MDSFSSDKLYKAPFNNSKVYQSRLDSKTSNLVISSPKICKGWPAA